MSSLLLNKLAFGKCRYGYMVWPKSDQTIGKSLELYGEFAEGEINIMQRYICPGDTVVDIGANLGTTVLPFAKQVGEQGHVLAFEPQPLMLQCLNTTLTLNEIFNVRVMGCALAHMSGWSKIPEKNISEGGNYGALALSNVGVQVPVIRLDELILDSCALIKIDVEGFEWEVMQGANLTVLKHRPVVYFEAKQLPGTESCIKWFLDKGWNCYWHFALFYRGDNFRGNKNNIFGVIGDMNILAVPPEKEQPVDLPRINDPGEDWRDVYNDFYAKNKIEMI